jgi:hypothetical protein
VRKPLPYVEKKDSSHDHPEVNDKDGKGSLIQFARLLECIPDFTTEAVKRTELAIG